MQRRAWDEGASERRPVTGRIGVEPSDDITPRASGLTSLGSSVTRELDQPAEGKADVGGGNACWCVP